nr:uncharacterized protein LOC128676881 [Plodia interpunctella]
MAHTFFTITWSPYIKFLEKVICTFFHRECGYSCQFYDASRYTNYDKRKNGSHISLPGKKYVTTPFDSLNELPTDVFRCTDLEEIGPPPGAGKCRVYKNPEYFAFHNLTYYDLHHILRKFRNPSMKTGRKP